ncbi:MAG: Flp pilus assembly complex ATPase component TadA [Alphaproteobacteria bacterium]|nr:Flp pilus assembly complex ATPase component TadA [Alphaproteobacteria bacterium]MBQ8631285.1 Flp pilus assembly complex ATPase component TadA [Alphaproteobacteria bacterium]
MSFKVLESVLRPLSYWYTQDNIEEVAINRSKQIWLRLRGKRAYPWVMYKDEKLTKEYLTDLLYIIANTYELPFDPVSGTPVVYAAIPGEHRFSAIAGRNIMYDDEDLTGGIALTIRVHSEDVAWGLKDYGLAQGEKLHKINPLKDIKDPEDPYERLLISIKRGDHILVSGATSTGKTTFLNNLLKILDIHKRILTIEDTRELMVPHPNRVHLVLSRTAQTNELTYAKVIDLVVRFTPDAIIGGEISTGNAGAIWELMGSGHDNCLATIHAESSEAAYAAFADRILHSYPTMDRKKIIEEMRQKLRVVQINRDGNLRAVTEVR